MSGKGLHSRCVTMEHLADHRDPTVDLILVRYLLNRASPEPPVLLFNFPKVANPLTLLLLPFSDQTQKEPVVIIAVRQAGDLRRLIGPTGA